jgi:hypothetical protein
MAEWDPFINAAVGGQYTQAMQWLNSKALKPAWDACFALATTQPSVYRALWDAVPYGNRASDFALDFIEYGYMPQRMSHADMSWDDYDVARELYLRALEKTKRPPWWPDRHAVASSVCLYPDYFGAFGRRTAIIELANWHSDLGPTSPAQASLFCLGGRYTYSIGKAGAAPTGPGTTCMLFARSILHASGINVIGPNTPRSCSCDKGLSAEIAHLSCYVSTKTASSPPTPKPGDIFLIQGPNFKGGYGSAHVGVITMVNGSQWTCVQGGASDHITRQKVYTVKPMVGSTTWGNWYFEEDAGVSTTSGKALRGIQGYWDIDRIGSGNFMNGLRSA